MRQSQSFIVWRTDDEFSLLKFSYLKHSTQSLTANLSLIFESLSYISFSAIDETINDNIDLDFIKSRESKDICAEIISNALNKREQIHAIKKCLLIQSHLFKSIGTKSVFIVRQINSYRIDLNYRLLH